MVALETLSSLALKPSERDTVWLCRVQLYTRYRTSVPEEDVSGREQCQKHSHLKAISRLVHTGLAFAILSLYGSAHGVSTRALLRTDTAALATAP
jgi:hypothetical protein